MGTVLLKGVGQVTISGRHAADLGGSGIDPRYAERADWYSTDGFGVAEVLGHDEQTRNGYAYTGGLVIPYTHTTPTTYRVRPDWGPTKFKMPKYLSRKGAAPRVYIPPQVARDVFFSRRPLVVTEGEKKALKASQEGIVCVGFAGCYGWSFRGGVIEDVGKIQLTPNRPVVIILDSDDDDPKHDVQRAAKRLHFHLASRGAKVKTMWLPRKCGKGIDDYMVRFGSEKFRELVRLLSGVVV